MEKSAIDVLRQAKRSCRVWRVATIITLTISVLELVVILF